MFRTPRALFSTLALAEAVSWTLLITGLILRAAQGWEWATTVGGSIHGFVFLSYGATVILTAKNQRWSIGFTIVALVTAVVPYATIPMEIWAKKRGLLEGAWRRDATPDPRDHTWHDKSFRYLTTHPVLTILALVIAVVMLYTVLLLIGPPVQH